MRNVDILAYENKSSLVYGLCLEQYFSLPMIASSFSLPFMLCCDNFNLIQKAYPPQLSRAHHVVLLHYFIKWCWVVELNYMETQYIVKV